MATESSKQKIVAGIQQDFQEKEVYDVETAIENVTTCCLCSVLVHRCCFQESFPSGSQELWCCTLRRYYVEAWSVRECEVKKTHLHG